jgi:hypothetical protein
VSSNLAIQGLLTILSSRTSRDKHSVNTLIDLNALKRISGLVCLGVIGIGTLRKMVYGIPDAENMDFEKCAFGKC